MTAESWRQVNCQLFVSFACYKWPIQRCLVTSVVTAAAAASGFGIALRSCFPRIGLGAVCTADADCLSHACFARSSAALELQHDLAGAIAFEPLVAMAGRVI